MDCIKRRTVEWLDVRGLRADHETVFVKLDDEVLLAIRDWYFVNFVSIKKLFNVNRNNNWYLSNIS